MPQEPTNAIAKTNKRTLMESMQTAGFKDKIATSLPRHCSPDRFVRIALTTLVRTPKLADCTEESVLQCCYQLSSLGLEPDGRRAHLIPFGNTCTLIVDYKGIVELVRRSGDISYIAADVVCENDFFDYMKGSGAFLKHKPNFKDRGNPICVYSFVKLKDGSEDFDIMSVVEVEKVRSRSRSGKSGPWVSDWNEMAKKTIFRRHSKWLPLSPELQEAVAADDEPLTEAERFEKAKNISPVFDGPEMPKTPEESPKKQSSRKPPKEADPIDQPQDDPDEVAQGLAPKGETTETTTTPGKVLPDLDHPYKSLKEFAEASGIPEKQLTNWARSAKNDQDIILAGSKVTAIMDMREDSAKYILVNWADLLPLIKQAKAD